MKYSYFIILLTLTLLSCGKETEEIPTTFDKIITQTLFNQDETKLYDFVITDDQSIVLAYNGVDPADINDDSVIDSTFIQLQKMNNLGEPIWTKSYHTATPSKVYDIIQSQDGGYLLSGQISAFDMGFESFILLIKTNSEGNMLWLKTIESVTGGEGFQIDQMSNGNIVILANRVSKQMIELDLDGNEIRRVTPYLNSRDYAYDMGMCVGYNDLVVLCGRGMTAYSNGTPKWDASILVDEFYFDPLLLSVSPVETGGYMGFGYILNNQNPDNFVREDYLLVKVDDSGNTVWIKTIENEDNDMGYDINLTSDGNFIAIGESMSYTPELTSALHLFKFDPDGNILWQHTMQDEYAEFIESCSIRQIDVEHSIVMYIEMRLRNPQPLTELRLAKIKME